MTGALTIRPLGGRRQPELKPLSCLTREWLQHNVQIPEGLSEMGRLVLEC